MSTLAGLSLLLGLLAAPVQAPRQFSLDCTSTDASARHFAIDVNLDLGTHYSDFHGLGPLGAVDGRRIVMRIPDAKAAGGFNDDEYRRDTGQLFWGGPPADGGQPAPGAVCKAGPPRPGFGATRRYQAAGG